MKVGEIDKLSNIELKTISPERSVHEAIRTLAEYNIGALPVVDGDGALVGIITERDVLRLMAGDTWQAALALPVADVMTKELIVGVADDDVGYLMRVMTDRRIRHIPVLDGPRLINIISIGDLVKAQADATETEIRFMRDYMQS